MMRRETIFLSLEDVLLIHADTIERDGGDSGILSLGMIESAVAMPRQMFGGELLHPDLASQAAAYLFHLVMGRGFVDGNKRTGAMATLVFLRENGCDDLPMPEAFEELVLKTASRQVSKDEVIAWMRSQLGE